MKRWLLLVLVTLVAVPVSAGVWPFGKDRTYNLGTDPTPGGMHALDDGVGFVGVESYDRDDATLSIKILSGSVALEPDEDSDAAVCRVRERIALRPGQYCALWGKDDTEKREYHLRISWAYETKKGIRVVVLRVKKATLKLAK
jgi:hypothetical protein